MFKKNNKKYFSELLWVAPELLPLTIIPGTPATQKGKIFRVFFRLSDFHYDIIAGDVYSFAIILEEIVVRGELFDFHFLNFFWI